MRKIGDTGNRWKGGCTSVPVPVNKQKNENEKYFHDQGMAQRGA